MTRTSQQVRVFALFLVCLLVGCAQLPIAGGGLSYAPALTNPLANYALSGDTHSVLDPSIIRQAGTFYLFSTDVLGSTGPGSISIRCSSDKAAWTSCGTVFPGIPAWIYARVPGLTGLWAPDISYFNGAYHLYYAASTLRSQHSIIGLVTTPTLDHTDPAYQWTDRGEVLSSFPGDDFNALDPNILVDTDGSVYLTYGSYWSGIKQVQIDPATGAPSPDAQRYDLAARPATADHPIEGASLIHHDGFYYLFVSVDFCCRADYKDNNYKQAVGRSLSPHGPFIDTNGTPMLTGGSTVLLQGDGTWNAPGGGTPYLDPTTGDTLLVFHALNMSQQGAQYAWLKTIIWQDGWPTIP